MTRAATRGRFAPSPSGPLHFGSLVAAVGSFLEARSGAGAWLVRMEDIDTPRVVPGAAGDILRTLERHGMSWDGPVVYQSQRTEYYQAALERLIRAGLGYACSCSRRDISKMARIGSLGMIYPGLCRNGAVSADRPWAIRLRTNSRTIVFHDRIQGNHAQSLESEVGDFVIRRADGVFAYQLAVVVDDAAQGVTHVVRGCDLLDSTPRQIYMQGLLGLPTPQYSHLPVVVNRHGDKLSKQTRAKPLDPRRPGSAVVAALRFLNQNPPEDLAREKLRIIWAWALENWRSERIPAVPAIHWSASPAPVTNLQQRFLQSRLSE